MVKIGKPFTPSTITDKKEIKLTELTITCGGGMGGSRWEVYTKDKFDLNEKFIKIDTNRCKNNIINTNFIVQVKPVRIFKISVKNDGNRNMRQKVGTTEDYYYLIPDGEEVQFVEEYADNDLTKIRFAK
jgi:hypothetical protein